MSQSLFFWAHYISYKSRNEGKGYGIIVRSYLGTCWKPIGNFEGTHREPKKNPTLATPPPKSKIKN
jgi:hypothetical protein